MASTNTLKLNTGATIPAVGLGTWQSPPGEVAKAVEAAIKSGYRHIDAAWIYGNEKEVGEGIKNSGIPRSELFVTTKVWGTYHRDPQKNLAKSLENLGLDYVDLLLVHWPVPLNPASGENIPLRPDGSRDIDEQWSPEETWKLMEKIPQTGIPFLQKLLKISTVVPAANQVENHPYLPQDELVNFCKEKGILVQAYSPLGSTGAKVIQDPLIVDIAKAHSADPAQVVLSWQVQRGVNPLPKSVTPSRIETNGKLIQLSDEEMKKINELHKEEGKGKRLIAPKWGVPLGFEDL